MELQLARLVHEISEAHDSGKHVVACFFDLSKAFDRAWYRPVAPTLEVGQPWKGVRGVLPGEISKIEADCKHFRAFGAISVYGNYNESVFDSATNKKALRSGTNITLPRGNKFKN